MHWLYSHFTPGATSAARCLRVRHAPVGRPVLDPRRQQASFSEHSNASIYTMDQTGPDGAASRYVHGKHTDIVLTANQALHHARPGRHDRGGGCGLRCVPFKGTQTMQSVEAMRTDLVSGPQVAASVLGTPELSASRVLETQQPSTWNTEPLVIRNMPFAPTWMMNVNDLKAFRARLASEAKISIHHSNLLIADFNCLVGTTKSSASRTHEKQQQSFQAMIHGANSDPTTSNRDQPSLRTANKFRRIPFDRPVHLYLIRDKVNGVMKANRRLMTIVRAVINTVKTPGYQLAILKEENSRDIARLLRLGETTCAMAALRIARTRAQLVSLVPEAWHPGAQADATLKRKVLLGAKFAAQIRRVPSEFRRLALLDRKNTALRECLLSRDWWRLDTARKVAIRSLMNGRVMHRRELKFLPRLLLQQLSCARDTHQAVVQTVLIHKLLHELVLDSTRHICVTMVTIYLSMLRPEVARIEAVIEQAALELGVPMDN